MKDTRKKHPRASQARSADPGKVPLVVLSGFLGAGKTTLLNHLLRNAGGRRIGVLVNDLGEVNIDADLLRGSGVDLSGGMIELTSGCICCSIQMELAGAVMRLLDDFSPDMVIIEASGVAEPLSILGSLYAADFDGRRATDRVEIINAVTVISAMDWDRHLRRTIEPAARRRLVAGGGMQRPYPELLVEQIECADVLVLSKLDVLPDGAEAMRRWLRGLNPRAELLGMDVAGAAVEALLGQVRFDPETTPNAAAWKERLGGNRAAGNNDEHRHHHHPDHSHPPDEHGEAGHHHLDYGIDTFVFRCRRPFAEAAFLRKMREGWPGLLRAKGFYWVRERPERVGLVSVAGNIIRADYLGLWWYERVRKGEARAEDVPEVVRRVWQGAEGDRRQEIVFIGIGLDRDRIEADLRGALA